MKFTTSIVVALFASVTSATPIEKRHNKFFVHQIEKYDISGSGKRDESLNFDDTGIRYTVDLEIGSSKEKVKVMIDTGSWRLNIPGPNAPCLGTGTCPAGSVFHPDKSTTFKNSSISAASYYGRGKTSVIGYTVHDDLFLDNGDKIPQFEFDLANYTSFQMGWFGVRHSTYPSESYVYAAKKAGLIDTPGFSLYLGSDEKTGTFLVGGVDRAKYEGDFAFFESDFVIQGKSITTGNGTVLPLTNTVEIDSGNPYLSLDKDIFDAINKEVGANEYGVAPCDQVLNTDKSLKVDLGDVTIEIPYSDLYFEKSDKPGYCDTYITDTYETGGAQNLGLPFIRQIYLTSSFDSKKLGIAPVKYTDESDIVDFWF
ncbi:SAP98 [Candida margitis]|uniref:SAP98 n=1 Tax=Candida margitis TaxID=1775924 RepID=UPI002225F1D9|nr:SAP98 [Candida margitis]KAI5968545.1 SAP98 [Candida margitis]